MLVSVIIPIYNVSNYLNDCLLSCVNQAYNDIEFICVNDGSTDNSGEIADLFARKDSRFKVFHKNNGGLPSARKYGIEKAQGKYIFHLDGDDNIPRNTIRDLVEVASKKDADIVIGNHTSFDISGEKVAHDSLINCELSGKDYIDFILTHGLFNIWGKLIRRDLYFSNPIQIPPRISMGEDLVQMIQLAYYSKKCVPCKLSTYNYYVRPTSMSNRNMDVVGSLTNRSIYAVEFVARFLKPRGSDDTLLLLSKYVKRFIYEYLRSPYSTSSHYNELKTLVEISKKYSGRIYSFTDLVCLIAAYNLKLSKSIVKISQLIKH